MLLAALQNAGYGLGFYLLQRVGHPRGAAAERVVCMPRQGNHSALVVVGDNFLTDTLERYTVQIQRVA